MYIAIVGSRACTAEEYKAAYDLGFRLARAGVVVVSGLARGIDSAALLGAVDAGKPAVAVVPTAPIEGVYPRSNDKLAKRIAKAGGVVLTPFQTPCHEAWHLRRRLIERNFLMANYSDAAVVVSDTPFIEGGTSWMVSFCQFLGRPVYRLDSRGCLDLAVMKIRRKVNWQPELPELKGHF